MDAPPKLTDLPNELLSLIFEYLDSDSLFCLSMTCMVLHYAALAAFFEGDDLKRLANGLVFLHRATTARKILQALRMALFVEKLNQIHYYLNPGLDNLLGEVRELRRLVARLLSVEQVQLHFLTFDSWLAKAPINEERPELDVDIWRKEFGSMLDQFLAKGCRQLHVTGGSRLGTIYMYPPETMEAVIPLATDVEQLHPRLASSLQPLIKWEAKLTSRTFFAGLRRKFTSLLRKVPAKAPPQSTTPLEELAGPPPLVTGALEPISSDPGIKPSLHEFYVHCEMMLQPPFLEWTLSMLQLNGECITTLSFYCIDIASEVWSDFFAAVTFPSLSKFEITSDLFKGPQGPKFPCIESFLVRHPSITLLHLDGLLIPSTFPPAQKSILPNLDNLVAHPAYVSWLLSSPNPLPCSGFITLSSEYYPAPGFEYAHFNDALASIARNIGQVRLNFWFRSKNGVDAWFQDHVDIGCEVSAVSQLTEIKNLAIYSSWFVDFSKRTLEILPEFLALFPSLEHVGFMEQPRGNEEVMLADGFVKAIALRCPRIKSVVINRQRPLQRLRE